MLEYAANLSSKLFVDSDFSVKAWAPCVQPYLGCFLPPDARPDAVKRACGIFRTRREKQSECNRMGRWYIVASLEDTELRVQCALGIGVRSSASRVNVHYRKCQRTKYGRFARSPL